MPAPLKVDWSLAEAMFKEGIGLKQIAKRTGIPYPGLQKRSTRYNWKPTVFAPSPATDFKPVRSRPKPVDVTSLASQWKDKVMDIANVHLSTIADRSTPDVTLDTLEKLVRVLDATDRTARRTLGMDTDGHLSVTLQVQSELPAQRQLEDRSEVLEVETVPNLDTSKTPADQ